MLVIGDFVNFPANVVSSSIAIERYSNCHRAERIVENDRIKSLFSLEEILEEI